MQGQNRNSLPTFLLVALVMLLIGGAGGWFFFQQMGANQGPAAGQGEVFTLAPGEVFLEPAADIGPDPFSDVPLASPPDPAIAQPVVNENAAVAAPQQVSIQANSGSEVGLYGGSLDNASCNVSQLVNFLSTNPEKATAWIAAQNADPLLRFAGGQLTPADIPNYITSLTPIVLLADTRVTNHGFEGGMPPIPRQAVLQKGTAVLIDSYGVPRARCWCGNPLIPPVASNVQVTYVGRQWQDFNPATVSVVSPAPEPQISFRVVNPAGGVVDLPAGPAPNAAAATQPPVAAATQPPVAAATQPPAAATQPPVAAATQPPVAAATQPPVPATAVPAPNGYQVQVRSDPTGRISMPIPEGWETDSDFNSDDSGGSPSIVQVFRTSPNVAVANSSAFDTVSQLTVRHFWPSQPGQALDPNSILQAWSSATPCTQVGAPQAVSHPRLGAGIALSVSGCPNNPTAEAPQFFFPQPDGSVVRVSTTVLEERDRNYIQTVLDALTLPQVAAPAPPAVAQDCSVAVPNVPQVDVPVTNNTNEVLRIYWHDFSCQLQFLDYIVGPGATTTILGTSQSHRWSAVGLNGAPVASFEVPAGGGAWNIP